MTNLELLASLHKRFGIGSSKSSVHNDEAIAFGTVIQADNDSSEEEDIGNNEDDSDYIDDNKEEKTHEHIAGKSKSVMDEDDDDASLIEVMDVIVGCDDNVSLHTQPSEEQVRCDDCHADVDSVSSIDNTDDIDIDANADVDDSKPIVTHNGITCNVASIAKLLEGGKVKDKQQL